MRILVISAAFPPMHAGEATNAYYLCKQLADRNFDVHVLTSASNVGTVDHRLTVHPIMKAWSWRTVLTLRAFVKRCDPDAVFLMYLGLMYDYHPMITFAPTIVKRVLNGVPFVTRYENAFVGADPQKTSLVSRLFRRAIVQFVGSSNVAYSSGTLLRDSDQVIVLCERHRAMVLEEWRPSASKIVLIPPPPNMIVASNSDGQSRRRGREKLNLKDDEFVIGFLGYIYPVKGVETLLQAFHNVLQKGRSARLVFIGGKNDLDVAGGSSYLDRVIALTEELGLAEKTIWTGTFTAEDEMASCYLHAMDVCVLPFLEGVQLNNSSFASIAAHGIPVIATRGPVCDEQFIHDDNILLCEPRNPNAIADAILRFMDDPALRSRIEAGIRKLANEWFSWQKATSRTLQAMGLIEA